MNRNQFLKNSILATGTLLLPYFSLGNIFQDYTKYQLIGKGNPDLVGETYTSIMQKDTAIALQKMQTEALKEGIKIEVVSAYRSFERQKEIFENKYKSYIQQRLSPEKAIKKIIEYSTIPGTSRHHWGTDLDLIDGYVKRSKNVLVAENFHGAGAFCKMKEWMNEHANTFGFYEVYTNDTKRNGFKYEPWHFSYEPVSKPMLQSYKKLNIKNILLEEKVLGNNYFSENFIKKYRAENILDINPKLL